ncbi:MAG: host attachment protein [Xenococcaceae cyanobacterium MO_188.B32]|nr:host attachment protein [Xenococcaceae cyanobacterium MO_188.B32]
MGKFAVAVINGTQARFFILDSAASSEYESGPNLIEHKGLSDSTQELHGQELWANTKTGRNRGSNGQAHSYDDHRQNHKLEFEKRFANKISSAMIDLIQANQAKQLILVAEPQILGIMRESMNDSLFKNLNIQEVAKDICHFNVNQIHDYLAKKELLPACKKVYSR